MSSPGKDMLSAIRQVRKLHGQVALLLRAADTMMDKAGWERAGGNMAVTGCSTMIYDSKHWAPEGAFSFYRRPACPHVLALVCVLFDDVEKDRIDEPLACAAWFDYGPDGEVDNHWDYWYYRHHLTVGKRESPGQWVEAETDPRWTMAEHGVKKTHTMALPLVAIKDSDELAEHVVKPLLSDIQTHYPSK